MQSPIRCQKCGAYIPVDANFCGLCGTPISSIEEPSGEEQDSESTNREVTPVPLAQSANPASDIAPKNLGALLKETFYVYSQILRTMLWISLIASIPSLIAPFLLAAFPENEGIALSVSIVGGLFAGLLGMAATVYAVAQWYLGRKVYALASYVAALENGNLLLVAFLIFASAVILALMLIVILVGIPLLAFVLVIWFFYIQVIMIERKSPLESLRRSYILVKGSWWRVFGLVSAFIGVFLVGIIVAALPGILLTASSALVGNLLANLGEVFVMPLLFIGATLIYLDLRVRKEGYNLETLAAEMQGLQNGPAA